MDANEYLEKILADQDLPDDSDELKELQDHRTDVETLLRDGFPNTSLTIRYAGSKAKGTLNREAYDLDIACFVADGDTSAGDSLKDIYANVQKVLAQSYYVELKTSAIRLKSKEPDTYGTSLHIDVVPGRFVDKSKSDCFLHQEGAEKERLKTNLDVHIAHVRDSGVVPAIRLQKLWKCRRALQIRQFVFELLVIDLLKGKKDKPLSEQLEYVWTTIRDSADPISVEDPANPTGNDLSPLLTATIWSELQTAARTTLALIAGSGGWEAVFGPVPSGDENDSGNGKTSKLKHAAAAVVTPTRPWLPGKREG